MITNMEYGEKVEICFKKLSKGNIYKYKLFVKYGWFNWKSIFQREENKVYGLFLLGNDELQGVIAIQEHHDNQLIHIELMEASPFNRLENTRRKYTGVGKNLLCFAASQSFEQGFDGYVGLSVKRNFNDEYYLKLGAIKARGGFPPYYFFSTKASDALLHVHMPGGVQWCRN